MVSSKVRIINQENSGTEGDGVVNLYMWRLAGLISDIGSCEGTGP
jgi:hypothetical protein